MHITGKNNGTDLFIEERKNELKLLQNKAIEILVVKSIILLRHNKH